MPMLNGHGLVRYTHCAILSRPSRGMGVLLVVLYIEADSRAR
jgi:hypothetical protein